MAFDSIVSNSIKIVNRDDKQPIKVVQEEQEHSIAIVQEDGEQRIPIGLGGGDFPNIQIQLNNKVPKSLSILPHATSDQFNTSYTRGLAKLYVDANGEARYITMEELKQLNTKTIYVDSLIDGEIKTLSSNDIIMLKEG